MKPQSLMSVIIPVYNCEKYLSEAIESVMAQAYSPVELIVVDDGSTDNSAEVARRFKDKLRYVYQSHSGAGAARNQGIRSASGDFFAFLDADDIWVQDKLSRQAALFEANPSLDMVFGYIRQFHTPELKESLQEKIYFAQEVMPGYSCGTMLIKKESFFRVGLFDIERSMGEFIDWYLKAIDLKLHSLMLPEVVMQRRLHESNMGVRLQGSRSEYVKIVKASLDRRRKKESL